MNRKHIILSLSVIAMSAASGAFADDVFTPYKPNALRLPAVPIVVNDPYFSIWSQHDRLNDGVTRHWDDDEKPIDGLLRVDGKTYLFMGGADKVTAVAIASMAEEEAWSGRYTTNEPAEGWQQADFDDSSWKTGDGAFGSINDVGVRTQWTGRNNDIYIRREVTLSAADLEHDLYLMFSHDDNIWIYINGEKMAEGPNGRHFYSTQKLSSAAKSKLRVGRNVIAIHCHNNTGPQLADVGLYYNLDGNDAAVEKAEQTSVTVMPTSTYYTFRCGEVLLDLVFTAPMLMDDLDLLSTPVNYISYRVRSTDGKAHSVQLLLTASTRIASWRSFQPMETQIVSDGHTRYLKTGTIAQQVLAKRGDNICIDWGYLYLPETNGRIALGMERDVRGQFITSGKVEDGLQTLRSYKAHEAPTLAYTHDFGSVTEGESFAMIGYDEVFDIQYMYKQYKALWAHDGKVTIFDAFRRLGQDYKAIMERCKQQDKQIYDDGVKSGGIKYAEILCSSYRQVIAAHKLFRDDEGKLLFFSKENNSNGSVNTVDLTYPSAPLFLCYNAELLKGMMTSILDYSKSGRWTKPFAAHDIGTYPQANGQTYTGDMPLEESGNMLTLAAQICLQEGNTKYVDPYWDIFTTWAEYLVENGQDPANQLCTDDFAGHWAHNANLSIKAIMGVAAYGIMAKLRGDAETGSEYIKKAQEMAKKWESMAADGDHYRLAFDHPGTWSMKYNIVWDKLWQTNLFSDKVVKTELKYYQKHQNRYGLPLDSRKDYTKNDWIMWVAALTSSQKDFSALINPVWDYINETQTRVPISDWYDTKTGLWQSFRARSVIGGFWMKVLFDKQGIGFKQKQ